jgi:hypothetical protein
MLIHQIRAYLTHLCGFIIPIATVKPNASNLSLTVLPYKDKEEYYLGVKGLRFFMNSCGNLHGEE